MKKLMLIFVLFFLVNRQAFALMPKTHEGLNELISKNNQEMNSYLNDNLKISLDETVNGKSVLKWIKSGGITEDTDPIEYVRSTNHFHDPTVPGHDWSLAGFNWPEGAWPPFLVPFQSYLTHVSLINGRYYAESSAAWVQEPNQGDALGNYSWVNARQY